MAVQAAIVGLGDGGCSNLAGLKAAGADIVALCDPDEAALEKAAAMCNPPPVLFKDMGGLLKNSNARIIVIATPDDKHLDPVLQAIGAGRFVFVEKPVATDMKHLKTLAAIAEDSPERLLFGEKYSCADGPVPLALQRLSDLGPFMTGSTLYTMWNCGRIMGNGQWRTEGVYNPCAGGLSHNFMTLLLFARSKIRRVRATGQVLTYHELDRHGGFDTMEGTIEFDNGRRITWLVCLAVKGLDSPFGQRTITHTLQFQHGSICYAPTADGDRLVIDSVSVPFKPEESDPVRWAKYNRGVLYPRMWTNLLESVEHGVPPRHTIADGINVAATCALAFKSAQTGGGWLEIPDWARV